MDTPAHAGIALLILIGIGCAIGLTIAAVRLHRLHLAAQADYTVNPAGRPGNDASSRSEGHPAADRPMSRTP